MLRAHFTKLIALSWIGIIVLISLVILAAFSYQINYTIFFLVVSLIVILVIYYLKGDIMIKIPNLISSHQVDYSFVAVSAFLLFLNLFDTNLSILDFIKFSISVLILFIMPGWILLRFLNLELKTNKITLVIISFACSLGLTSLLYGMLLLLSVEINSITISLIYFVLSLIPLIRYRSFFKNMPEYKPLEKNVQLFEIILLAWVAIFFTLTIAFLYPQLAYVPGSDIIRHYSSILKLDDSPSVYSSIYPWFHFSLAALFNLSTVDTGLFQSGISFLSIFLILTFYIMARKYLSSIHNFLPLLATVFFTAFSGLGWIYYFQNFPSFTNSDGFLDFLYTSYFATYYDIGVGNSTWLWLWYRPITVGFTVFFALLFLLKNDNIRGKTNLVISTLLCLTLIHFHFSEFTIFVVTILVLSIFFPKLKVNYRPVSLAILLSLAISMILSFLYSHSISDRIVTFNLSYWVLLFLAGIGTVILIKYPRRPAFSFGVNSNRLISLLLFVYGILLLYWIFNAQSVRQNLIDIINNPAYFLAVPTSVYPILLGILGILAIPATVYLFKHYRSNSVIIFPIIMITVLLVSKIITFINIQGESLGYWERRMVPYVWLTICIISPLSIIKIAEYLKSLESKNKVLKIKIFKNLIAVTFISSFVFAGTLSTLLTIQYQSQVSSTSMFTSEESNIQQELLQYNPSSTLLTVSTRSQSVPEYTPLNYIIGYYKFQVWPSASPELPMNILFGLNNSALIYLNDEDRKLVTTNNYDDGYTYSHFVMRSIDQNKNNNDSLIPLPRMAPPTPNSENILVLPSNSDQYNLFSYDLLSMGDVNFTTSSVDDISTIKKANVIIAPNEKTALEIEQIRNIYDLNFEKLIILNLDVIQYFSNLQEEPVINLDNNSEWLKDNNDSGLDNHKNITLQFEKQVDLGKYNYFKVNWYGQGYNSTNQIQFLIDANNYYEYQFEDSWIGQRQLIIPIPDSNNKTIHAVDGTNIDFFKIGDPNWKEIGSISVQTVNGPKLDQNKLNFGNFLFNPNKIHLQNITMIVGQNSDTILSNNYSTKYKLPFDLPVNPIRHNNDYAEIASYTEGIPFVLQKHEEGYDTYLVNIFPIIHNLITNPEGFDSLYSFLDEVIELMNVNMTNYNFGDNNPESLVTGGIAAFKNFEVSGNITINSSSALIAQPTDGLTIEIDGQSFTLENVTEINSINTGNIEVKTGHAILPGGQGYYSTLYLPESSSINMIGDPVILSLVLDNGKRIMVEGSEINTILSESAINIRQPAINATGISKFENFYAYGDLNRKIALLGNDLEFEGKVFMNLKYSDIFTISEQTKFDGTIISPTLDYYRIIETLGIFKMKDVWYILILFLAFLLYNFYFVRKEKATTNTPT